MPAPDEDDRDPPLDEEDVRAAPDEDDRDPPLDEEDVRAAVEEAEPEHEPRRVRVFDEDGQTWAECLPCGRQWAAHCLVTALGESRVALEEVSAGDGSCSP